jgi:hypothetical protein
MQKQKYFTTVSLSAAFTGAACVDAHLSTFIMVICQRNTQ